MSPWIFNANHKRPMPSEVPMESRPFRIYNSIISLNCNEESKQTNNNSTRLTEWQTSVSKIRISISWQNCVKVYDYYSIIDKIYFVWVTDLGSKDRTVHPNFDAISSSKLQLSPMLANQHNYYNYFSTAYIKQIFFFIYMGN